MKRSSTETPASLDETPCKLVTTVAELDKLLEHLKQQTEIAVDLEVQRSNIFVKLNFLRKAIIAFVFY